MIFDTAMHRLAFCCVLGALLVYGATFTISPDGATFLYDGAPIQLFSGSVHYFRSLPEQWPARIEAARAMGLNTIQTYIAWNYHMPHNASHVSFEGGRNITHFFELVKAQNMHMLLRVGPYICAEWDYGGFPWWFLTLNRTMRVRTLDPTYMSLVRQWWVVLLPIVRRYLVTAGGPIVMVQIENEYGNFGDDAAYLRALRDMARDMLGEDIVLYSTDPPASIPRSAVYGIFQVVDFFGYGAPDENVTQAFKLQHSFDHRSLKGPNMNDEFYPGWLTTWQDPAFLDRSAAYVSRTLKAMLALNASFNFYMFHGGTNFAFWPGQMVITSYDYSAPLTEPGDPRLDKFLPVRALLQDAPWNRGRLPPIPNATVKTDYGYALFDSVAPLMHTLADIAASVVTWSTHDPVEPLGMELFGQGYGYIAYRFRVPVTAVGPSGDISVSIGTDSARDVADYVMVFCNEQYQGFALRHSNLTVPARCGLGNSSVNVTLVVENMGRENYGQALWDDSKGLQRSPLINGAALSRYDYDVFTLPMEAQNLRHATFVNTPHPIPASVLPAFFKGTLHIPRSAVLSDTFVDMRAWGKGFVAVNGFNLGRYWSTAGPQFSLYCPKEFIRHGDNDVIVFEQQLLPSTSSPLPLRFSNYSYNRIPNNPYAPPHNTR